jgi:hypothetical protein
MDGCQTGSEAAVPAIELRQGSVDQHGVMERWSIGWTITNTGAGSLAVVSVHLPHGQFKSGEHRFEPALDLAPGERGQFQLAVRCEEPPGLVTENAFVIFSVLWLGEAWRIFVRVRVVINDQGTPETATELITTQKVGFSGVIS